MSKTRVVKAVNLFEELRKGLTRLLPELVACLEPGIKLKVGFGSLSIDYHTSVWVEISQKFFLFYWPVIRFTFLPGPHLTCVVFSKDFSESESFMVRLEKFVNEFIDRLGIPYSTIEVQ